MSRSVGEPAQARSQATKDKILIAARDAFTSEGFDRTSTRTIAAAAGVNPALIFRYFGSKAALFEAAVLTPLQAFVEEFVATWDGYEREPHPATQTAAEWLGGLYDLFREHQELVLALLGPGRGAELAGESRQVADWIARVIDRVGVVIETEAARRGWSGFDTRMSIRIALGMALSLAVMQDWIFPDGRTRPDRDEIVRGMVSFVLRSMSNPGGPDGLTNDPPLRGGTASSAQGAPRDRAGH